MISRRDVAIRLDIPVEMATRHGIPARMSDAAFDELDTDPPAWLAQSRANRTGKPTWVTLECVVCGEIEHARPKKWWPEFTYLSCDFHDPLDIPEPAPGLYRSEVDGVGSRFVGIVDTKP